jgi:hypothetical protein
MIGSEAMRELLFTTPDFVQGVLGNTGAGSAAFFEGALPLQNPMVMQQLDWQSPAVTMSR